MRIDTTDAKRDYEEGDSEEDEGGIEDKIKAVSSSVHIIYIEPQFNLALSSSSILLQTSQISRTLKH